MQTVLNLILNPQYLILVYFSFIGVLFSLIVSFLPALHIYNVLGILMLLVFHLEVALPPMHLIALCIGMIVGYSIFNTVPASFFGPGDESMSYYVLPSADWLEKGRGYESVILTAIGSLGGIVIMAILAPLFIKIVPILKTVTGPHLFWILGAVIAYAILSEWPKGLSYSSSRLTNFLEGWKYLGIGLLTFFLASILGFIVMNKTLVPVDFAFQSITPVFVGLFAIPWLITNIINIGKVPKQHIPETVEIDWALVYQGSFSGFLGGFFAAFMPIVTAGIGGLLSSHATAQRDNRLFILSYGTCKTVYYVGSFLLFFIPGVYLTRGGLASIVSPVMFATGYREYFLFVAIMVFSAGISFLMLMPFTKACIRLVEKVNYKWVSIVTLVLLIPAVFKFTGFGGLAIMAVATGIGLMPVLFQARRMNLMAVLLVPVCVSMAGYGNHVLRFLGLI
ncbi:MAG: hypothetical protein GX221_06340 [Candidatus Riflebacteria bacterium]|nr:hypothetical protein [Candidatus Riflebacteria bacterium]